MKAQIISSSLLLILSYVANAEIRDYSYQILVDHATSVYQDPNFQPAPPAQPGDLLTGIIHLDDSIVDVDPSLCIGQYGSNASGSGPTNSFSFLNTTWTGLLLHGQAGMGWTVSNDTTSPTRPFGLIPPAAGDSLDIYAQSAPQNGSGGTRFDQKLHVLINDPAAGWLNSDALPLTFPEFTGNTTGLVRYTLDRVDRGPGGIPLASRFSMEGHIVNLTLVPEPSTLSLGLLVGGLCFRRRRSA